jgi:hypothetical protein
MDWACRAPARRANHDEVSRDHKFLLELQEARGRFVAARPIDNPQLIFDHAD